MFDLRRVGRNLHGVEIVCPRKGKFTRCGNYFGFGGSTGLKCGPHSDEKNNRVDVFDLPRVGRNLHGVEIVCPWKGKFTRGGNYFGFGGSTGLKCGPRGDEKTIELMCLTSQGWGGVYLTR